MLVWTYMVDDMMLDIKVCLYGPIGISFHAPTLSCIRLKVYTIFPDLENPSSIIQVS